MNTSHMGSSLEQLVATLGRHYGPRPSSAPKDPFQLLLWEYVAYLADDETRASAFAELEATVGLKPAEVAGTVILVPRFT